MSGTETSLDVLLRDLAVEQAELDAVLPGATGSELEIQTPAEGWSVRDQLSHLAFFDDAATMALRDPKSFETSVRALMESEDDPMEEHLRRGRSMAGRDVLEWWREARNSFLQAAAQTPPDARVPWYGPPTGMKSFVSARLMETWAHGQDIVDALGIRRRGTERLRHVAHLGVRARPFSYAIRGRDVPDGSILVELVAPSGTTWTWTAGDPNVDDTNATAAGSIRGSALEFCLVVTQRRNLADTSLEVDGGVASDWLDIAQAFAGPPGKGRPPGAPPAG